MKRRTFLKATGAAVLAPAILVSGKKPLKKKPLPKRQPKIFTGVSRIDAKLMKVCPNAGEQRRTEDRFFIRGMLHFCKYKNLTPINIRVEDCGLQKRKDFIGMPYEVYETRIALHYIEGKWNGKGFVPIYFKGGGNTMDDISL